MGRKEKTVDSPLRRARQHAGLTLTDLAARTGYTSSYLSAVERGSEKVTQEVVTRYEAVLQLAPGTLAVTARPAACDQATAPSTAASPAERSTERTGSPRFRWPAGLVGLGVTTLVALGTAFLVWTTATAARGVPTRADVAAAPVSTQPQPPTASAASVRPGGVWLTPDHGTVITRQVPFAARAYPTNRGDPAIESVEFTVSWEGRPGPWLVACRLSAPAYDDVYACTWDPTQSRVPAGPVRVSFDVYDQAGNKNLAPHGTRTLTYSPAP